MPIYEYVCESCGEAAEIMQKLSDPPETECPACHAPSLRKQVSAAGFRLSGGGWYETDFKSGGKKNLAGDTTGSSSSSEAGAACAPGGCDKPACAAKADTTASA